jgi:hypothetical protein
MKYEDIIQSIHDGNLVVNYNKIISFDKDKMQFYSDRIKELFEIFDDMDDNNYMKSGIYIKFYLIYNSLLVDGIITDKRDININKIIE